MNIKRIIKDTSIKSFFFLVIIFIFQSSVAQVSNGLKDLLSLAEKNHPSIAAKKALTQSAQYEIKIQQNTIVPSLDAAYQADYATYNNITGMAYPQYIIPISGPPATSNNFNGVFGSAAGLLLNWQPITFGKRNAQVNAAQQTYQLSVADENNTVLQQKLNLISVYLNVVIADELIKVYEENITRIQTQLKQITSLVKSGIRPGADTSLFQAELSKAKVDLYNTEQYLQQQKNSVAQFTGDLQVQVKADSFFAQHLPLLPHDTLTVHPLLLYGKQLIQVQQANKLIIQKSLLPTFNLWSTVYARGSGIKYNGAVKPFDGLAFSRYNYGIGVQVSVPILRYTTVRLQLKKQDALIKNYQSQLQETELLLKRDSLNADVALNNSIKVANETPVQLYAANVAYRSIFSRYNAGLASLPDVLQTQYALIKAQTDVKQSYLQAWKALLLKAAAEGDVNIFLNELQ